MDETEPQAPVMALVKDGVVVNMIIAWPNTFPGTYLIPDGVPVTMGWRCENGVFEPPKVSKKSGAK